MRTRRRRAYGFRVSGWIVKRTHPTLPTEEKIQFEGAVANQPVVDLRGRPQTASERVSQVVLGTPLVVRKEARGWLYVTTPDAYRGWVVASSCVRFSDERRRYASDGKVVQVQANLSPLEIVGDSANVSRLVTIGTILERIRTSGVHHEVRLPDGRLGHLSRTDAGLVRAGGRVKPGRGAEIATFAHRFLGVPYLWGGTTPLGFDCSGLVQLCYRLHGLQIPRDADQQFAWGHPVGLEDTRPADLLFFSRESTGITHVGMVIDRHRFLHASGRARGVTINRTNDAFYRSIFVGARRFLTP
jgi:gamma-D-glutamyl-L-lysine dipeptidyl-peptidase